MKVYNKSLLPIVYRDDWRGRMVIQPGKFAEIGDNFATIVLKKYPGACTEAEFKAYKAEQVKKREESKRLGS